MVRNNKNLLTRYRGDGSGLEKTVFSSSLLYEMYAVAYKTKHCLVLF